MGSGAYNVISKFCINCLRFTDHRVSENTREATDTIKIWDSNEQRYKDDWITFCENNHK